MRKFFFQPYKGSWTDVPVHGSFHETGRFDLEFPLPHSTGRDSNIHPPVLPPWTRMGIKGLLKELMPLGVPRHIQTWRGRVAGVDAMAWLHRASFNCASDLVLARPTLLYLKFLTKLLRMMKKCEVRPLLVFDGLSLPVKGTENERRKEIREANRAQARELLGRGSIELGEKLAQRGVQIT